jgi:hypothetical protein
MEVEKNGVTDCVVAILRWKKGRLNLLSEFISSMSMD